MRNIFGNVAEYLWKCDRCHQKPLTSWCKMVVVTEKTAHNEKETMMYIPDDKDILDQEHFVDWIRTRLSKGRPTDDRASLTELLLTEQIKLREMQQTRKDSDTVSRAKVIAFLKEMRQSRIEQAEEYRKARDIAVKHEDDELARYHWTKQQLHAAKINDINFIITKLASDDFSS